MLAKTSYDDERELFTRLFYSFIIVTRFRPAAAAAAAAAHARARNHATTTRYKLRLPNARVRRASVHFLAIQMAGRDARARSRFTNSPPRPYNKLRRAANVRSYDTDNRRATYRLYTFAPNRRQSRPERVGQSKHGHLRSRNNRSPRPPRAGDRISLSTIRGLLS